MSELRRNWKKTLRQCIHHHFTGSFFTRLHKTFRGGNKLWHFGKKRNRGREVCTAVCAVTGEGQGMFFLKDFKLCGSGSDSGSENLDGCRWCVCAQRTFKGLCECVCVHGVISADREIWGAQGCAGGRPRHKKERGKRRGNQTGCNVCAPKSSIFSIWQHECLAPIKNTTIAAVKCWGETNAVRPQKLLINKSGSAETHC